MTIKDTFLMSVLLSSFLVMTKLFTPKSVKIKKKALRDANIETRPNELLENI